MVKAWIQLQTAIKPDIEPLLAAKTCRGMSTLPSLKGISGYTTDYQMAILSVTKFLFHSILARYTITIGIKAGCALQ